MNNKTKVFINGIETREKIGIITGKANGIKKICDEAGLASEALNQACLYGYGYAETLTKYMKAGIPIVTSSEPIPSRAKNRHSRSKKEEKAEQIDMFDSIYPSIPVEKSDLLKDLIIKHMTAFIKELRTL